MPETFNVAFLERAAEPGVVFGSKAVGEPPLMLAFSVREAIREAIAAFGDGGPVELDSPATLERIYWAIERARAKLRQPVVPAAKTSAQAAGPSCPAEIASRKRLTIRSA